MKLEEGMYVRHHYFGIGRIINSYEKDNKIWFNVNFKCYGDECHCGICEQSIGFKASHNIIDLIEVGDILTFKNDKDVYRVSCVPNKKYGCDEFWLVFEHEGAIAIGCEDIEVLKDVMESELESIVTKEQFENISYKVN